MAQQHASSVRDTEAAHSAIARRQQSSAIDEQGSIVETTDSDTQVHSEAEGTGSQGRAFSETADEQRDTADNTSDSDSLEGLHIDLEA